jgi:hypothetical protein
LPDDDWYFWERGLLFGHHDAPGPTLQCPSVVRVSQRIADAPVPEDAGAGFLNRNCGCYLSIEDHKSSMIRTVTSLPMTDRFSDGLSQALMVTQLSGSTNGYAVGKHVGRWADVEAFARSLSGCFYVNERMLPHPVLDVSAHCEGSCSGFGKVLPRL